MELPGWIVLALVNLLLIAGGLIVFLPKTAPILRLKDGRRVLEKYGKYLLAALAAVLVHLFLLRIDAPVTSALGWDFAPQIDQLERGAVPSLQHLWNPVTDLLFSAFHIIIHPWMVYFAALLFILTDEERPAKAALLVFPLAYLLALPFYLLLPATNVFTYYEIQSPVFQLFPQLVDIYYNATTPNNTFPSLHVAFALLLANAARYSRNQRFRWFSYVYAAIVTFGALYLNLTWLVDVLGAILVAFAVGVFTSRFISTERLALQRVKPSPDEAQETRTAADRLVARVQDEVARRGLPCQVMLVGSVAKDTYLRSNIDLDVFVLFPTTTSREDLAKSGLELGRLVLEEPEEKYAEHPYIHGLFEGLEADVVPCYQVPDASQRITAVDRTPFHTRFVLERMERDQRDQTRLLKAFMKGVSVYGAEAKTHGFSGYLCELLILKYGTFRKVIDSAAGWKPGTFLLLDRLEATPKFTDPLVFLDPVDSRRNVASAVSVETLEHFAEASRGYLRREGLSYFFPRQLVPLAPDELESALRRRRSEFLLVRTRTPLVLEDHLHDQTRKAAAAVSKLLERYGFEVRRSSYELNEQLMLLIELPRVRLPDTVTHVGPPAKSRDHAERFRKTWTDHREARSPVYEEEGRLKVERVREYRHPDQVLRERLIEHDVGKHLNESLKQGYEVLSGLDVVQEETARLLTKHLNRTKSWEL